MREPVHLCTVTQANLPITSRIIARAIRMLWAADRTAAKAPYVVTLFIDDGGRAFILPDTDPVAELWLRTHRSWWIGCYSASSQKFGHCSAIDVIDRLTECVREDAG